MRQPYNKRESKEANIANRRQKMMETEHSTKDAFVKAQEAKVARYGGEAPKLEEKYMHFNAEMVINGEYASGLAKKMTAGLDPIAYPVRPEHDD